MTDVSEPDPSEPVHCPTCAEEHDHVEGTTENGRVFTLRLWIAGRETVANLQAGPAIDKVQDPRIVLDFVLGVVGKTYGLEVERAVPAAVGGFVPPNRLGRWGN